MVYLFNIRIDGNRTREEVAQDAMNLLKELLIVISNTP